jgi:hypothetical protein
VTIDVIKGHQPLPIIGEVPGFLLTNSRVKEQVERRFNQFGYFTKVGLKRRATGAGSDKRVNAKITGWDIKG